MAILFLSYSPSSYSSIPVIYLSTKARKQWSIAHWGFLLFYLVGWPTIILCAPVARPNQIGKKCIIYSPSSQILTNYSPSLPFPFLPLTSIPSRILNVLMYYSRCLAFFFSSCCLHL